MCLSGKCKQRERLRWGGSCFVMSDVVMISFDEESCNRQLGRQGGSQSRSTTVLVPGTCIGSLHAYLPVFLSTVCTSSRFEGPVQVGSAPSASHPQRSLSKEIACRRIATQPCCIKEEKSRTSDRSDADVGSLLCTGATRHRDGGDTSVTSWYALAFGCMQLSLLLKSLQLRWHQQKRPKRMVWSGRHLTLR